MAKSEVIAGFIDDPDKFLEIGEKAKQRGFRDLDGCLPYPVHGFEEKLGIKKSWIPSAAKTMLVIGAGLGFLFQSWTSAINWPINVGGKPLVSWPAFIPIVFEAGVLLAGITVFMSLIHIGRFFPYKNPEMIRERLTNDQFALIIPIKGNGTAETITEFFKQAGIEDVQQVLF